MKSLPCTRQPANTHTHTSLSEEKLKWNRRRWNAFLFFSVFNLFHVLDWTRIFFFFVPPLQSPQPKEHVEQQALFPPSSLSFYPFSPLPTRLCTMHEHCHLFFFRFPSLFFFSSAFRDSSAAWEARRWVLLGFISVWLLKRPRSSHKKETKTTTTKKRTNKVGKCIPIFDSSNRSRFISLFLFSLLHPFYYHLTRKWKEKKKWWWRNGTQRESAVIALMEAAVR